MHVPWLGWPSLSCDITELQPCCAWRWQVLESARPTPTAPLLEWLFLGNWNKKGSESFCMNASTTMNNQTITDIPIELNWGSLFQSATRYDCPWKNYYLIRQIFCYTLCTVLCGFCNHSHTQIRLGRRNIVQRGRWLPIVACPTLKSLPLFGNQWTLRNKKVDRKKLTRPFQLSTT